VFIMCSTVVVTMHALEPHFDNGLVSD